MSPISKRFRCQDLIAVSSAYLIIFFSWLALYLLTGERFTIIALINFVAVYMFVPLVLVLIVAILCRSRWLGLGVLIGGAAFLWLWGGMYIPRIGKKVPDGSTLTVMTYNVLAWHNHYSEILETISIENPDVLLLQELNNGLAEVLRYELSGIYPYQELEPLDNPKGIGVISKFPISKSEVARPQLWAGEPQILELEWNGEVIMLVNIHMTPTTGILPRDEVEQSIRSREREAMLLADLIRQADTVILGGDANTTSLSDAYRILTGELKDSFREAGFGLGHTFPGSKIPESDRPHIGSLFVPPWLTRIDYIFHSDDWTVLSARTAHFDGVSDHRGVIVELSRVD